MSGSALLMTALLVHKRLENTRGTAAATAHKMREKLDPVLRTAHGRVNTVFGYLTLRQLWIALHDAVVRGGKLFMLFLRRTHAVISLIVEKASRRREDLSKGGAASFYLKQVKDAKEEVAKEGKKEIQG